VNFYSKNGVSGQEKRRADTVADLHVKT